MGARLHWFSGANRSPIYALLPLFSRSAASSGGTGLSGGAIAGIVIGVAAAVALAAAGAFLIYKKKHKYVSARNGETADLPEQDDTVRAVQVLAWGAHHQCDAAA